MVSAGLPLPGWSELDDPDEPLDPLLLLESLPQPAAMAATTTSAASKARVGANDMDAPFFLSCVRARGPLGGDVGLGRRQDGGQRGGDTRPRGGDPPLHPRQQCV